MFYKCLFIIIKRKNYEIIYLGLAPKDNLHVSVIHQKEMVKKYYDELGFANLHRLTSVAT